jgi:hypothetical protein
MSVCIRSVYSSDQRAPGFRSDFLRGCAKGGALLFLAGLCAPTFNVRVTRGDAWSEDKFELFMRLLALRF